MSSFLVLNRMGSANRRIFFLVWLQLSKPASQSNRSLCKVQFELSSFQSQYGFKANGSPSLPQLLRISHSCKEQSGERETGNGGRQGPTKLGEKEGRNTGLGSKVVPRLRECCRQSHAEVVRNSRKTIHHILGPPFRQTSKSYITGVA